MGHHESHEATTVRDNLGSLENGSADEDDVLLSVMSSLATTEWDVLSCEAMQRTKDIIVASCRRSGSTAIPMNDEEARMRLVECGL